VLIDSFFFVLDWEVG